MDQKKLITAEESLKIKKIKQDVKDAINSNKKFLDFLKKNKIYGRYVKNTTNHITKNSFLKCDIIRYIRMDVSPINYGFTWAATSEKHEFWKEYSRSYNRL